MVVWITPWYGFDLYQNSNCKPLKQWETIWYIDWYYDYKENYTNKYKIICCNILTFNYTVGNFIFLQ